MHQEELITQIDPKSPTSEAFKALRTNVQFINANSNIKTILVTSPMPSEGKSWIATNLAISFAQMGKKVLIVDADMRKGRQHSILNVPRYPGLSNFLLGMDKNGNPIDMKADLDSHIKQTKVENLYIIPIGNKPANPSELVVSDKMIELIELFKIKFDIIVFDGTPSLLVTDAVILSRRVDTTVIVAMYDKTKISEVEKVKKDIQNVGGKIAGIIINKIPSKNKKYKYGYYA